MFRIVVFRFTICAMFVFVLFEQSAHIHERANERTNRVEEKKQKRLDKYIHMHAVAEHYLNTHIDEREKKQRNYYLSNQKRQKCRAIFGSSAENTFWYSFPVDVHLKPGRLSSFPILTAVNYCFMHASVCMTQNVQLFLLSPLVSFQTHSIEIIRRMYTLHLTWLFTLSDVCISTL